MIEILSRDDTMHTIEERVDDYLDFGVPHIWVVDPGHRRAYVCNRDGFRVVDTLRIEEPAVEVALGVIFADLD